MAAGASAKVVPPDDIKAELDSFSGGDNGVTCRLIDWIADPAHEAPPTLVPFAMRFRAACTLPLDGFSPADARALLAGKPFAARLHGPVLTVVASAAKQPDLCCSVQGPMKHLGDGDLWAARYRLERPDEAMLFLVSLPSKDPPLRLRGPRAPLIPPKADALKGHIVDAQLKSAALGETRKLRIYVPPGIAPAGGWPTLYLADGGADAYAPIVEALVAKGLTQPLLIVGVLSGQEGIVEDRKDLHIADLRGADDLRGFDKVHGRFEAHMKFFSDELVAFARRDYGASTDPARTLVSGYSNGGVLAFHAGLMHPEVFGVAIPMSAGYLEIQPSDLRLGSRARFFASAGLYEGPFHAVTSKAVATLKDAGYQVEFTSYVAGHAPDQWEAAFAAALPKALPAESKTADH